MVTSNYMPDVKVEIAFTSDYSTPAASRTWTDVSTYVELDQGITITGGRSDARASAEANTMSVTLDNSDGRFTPLRTSSPYYPNVKLGRPIRVTAKPVGGGTTHTLFTGYVDSWPIEWIEGVDHYAVTRVTASSRLSRIGRSVSLKSNPEVEADLAGPIHHWTMGDPEGSTTAVDSVGSVPCKFAGNSGWPAPVFGNATGITSDGLTAVTFADSGRYLRAVVPDLTGDYTLSGFYATTDADSVIMGVGDALVGIYPSGKLYVGVLVGGGMSGSAADPGTAVNDGEVHHVALRFTKSTDTYECVRDGAVVASISEVAFVGGKVYVGSGGFRDAIDTLTGTVCHVSLFDYKVTTTDLTRIADAGDGFVDEAASARISRYARWAGIAAADLSSDTDAVTPMQAIDSTGDTVAGLLRKVESTEGGVLFDNRAGTLVYLSRTYRFNRAADATLPTTAYEAELGPRFDDSELVNRATATVSEALTISALNETSRDAYGLFDASFEILSTDSAEAEGRCWWTVNRFGEPFIRVPSLTVNMLALTLAQQDAVAVLNVGARIAKSGTWPTQLGTALDSGVYLEGWTETLGPESWFITLNVTPASLTEVFELNHATYGLLGNYPTAY